jgi:hypothetical protein
MAETTGNRSEQRLLLRDEQAPGDAIIIVRGGTDTLDKLRRHVERTARAWSLDGQPLLGVSVFAALDMSLDELLWHRFGNFQTIYTLTAGRLRNQSFELLPTGQRPHFTVRLSHAADSELRRLLAALGDVQPNPQYSKGRI